MTSINPQKMGIGNHKHLEGIAKIEICNNLEVGTTLCLAFVANHM